MVDMLSSARSWENEPTAASLNNGVSLSFLQKENFLIKPLVAFLLCLIDQNLVPWPLQACPQAMQNGMAEVAYSTPFCPLRGWG